MIRIGVFFLFLLSLSLEARKRYSFEDFVEKAMSQSGDLRMQMAQVEFAKARLTEARSKRWFTGSIEAIAGPAPGAEGNSVNSQTKWDEWGGFLASQVEIRQPIYTFGAISSAVSAAEEGINAESALLEKQKWQTRYEIAELYFGYQLAFELGQLGDEVVEKLEAAKKRSRGQSRREIVYALAEIKSNLRLAKDSKEQARLAMAWKTATQEGEKLYWDQSNLKVREIEILEEEEYMAMLKKNRPEWRALQSEALARQSLLEVEEGLSLPVLFLYAQGQYRWADHRRSDSRGPFSFNPSNVATAVAGLGLKWEIDVMTKSSSRAKARAEVMKAEAKAAHYRSGMIVELKKSLMDLKQKKESLELYSEAEKLAQKSYQDSLVAFGLNNLSGKKLIERMGQYAKIKRDQLQALYDFNLATVKLEQVVASR